MSKTKDEIEAEAKAKADAEAKAKADADAANQNDDGKDQNQDDSSSKIDYKAIAEEERKKREAAEQLIIKAKLDKKSKADDDDQDDKDNDDKPITRKDLDAVLNAQRQTVTKELYADRIIEIARDLSESEDEAQAIVEVHKSRNFPSHLTLKEQLEEIHAIVNRKRLISKNAELVRANKSKETASNDTAGTYRDGQEGTAPKMSDSDTKAYARAGFTYDTKDKLWKKKLPNGNTLIKDPKTKVTYVRPK